MNNSNGRKIKPVEHPNLVLKTPIAYHSDTDPSVIPIDKNGIGVCEKCGAIGVKHSFYTKQRRFCSLSCARSYTGLINVTNFSLMNEGNANNNPEDVQVPSRRQAYYRFKLMESVEHLRDMIPMEPFPQLPGMWQPTIDDFSQPIPKKVHASGNNYEWQNELYNCDFEAAPVKLFAHAPLSDMWNSIFEGMKVEVKNTDCENFSYKLSNYFWVASVLKLKGYMGLLRYEGFGNDESKDFWINLMHSEVHPVGWCATRGKPLIPPQSIENKYTDWKSFLVQQLTGARTLPTDFYNQVNESMKSRFRIGHVLEVVDKNRICQVKIATVHEIVGKRLHIRYYDNTPEDNGFWFHEDCPLIHPVGWAREVGHLLDAPYDYIERVNNGISNANDTTPDLFRYYLKKDPHNINFEPNFTEGMKLEAIDPLNLSAICVATVMKVLRHSYIMIRIDCYPPDETGSDWFCYHEYSPYIFPMGFCEDLGIPLTISTGQTSMPKTPSNIRQISVPHEFLPGMRLECADLMDPRLVCVATIAGVVGRLLKVHFNGWGDEYDQWLDCESTDIYPVGWCQAVGHKLEGPLVPVKPPTGNTRKKGRKKKGHKTMNDHQKNVQNRQDVEMGNSNDVYEFSVSGMEVGTDNFNLNMDDCKEESQELLPNDNSSNDQSNSINQQSFDEDIKSLSKSEFLEDDGISNNNNDLSMDTAENEHVEIKEEVVRPPKAIPRLVGVTTIDSKIMENVEPETWDVEDVAKFLSINDCTPYCAHFTNVTGKVLLEITKDEIIELLQMKVGPSLKIFDLIQQLKCKLKPMQARNKVFNINK